MTKRVTICMLAMILGSCFAGAQAVVHDDAYLTKAVREDLAKLIIGEFQKANSDVRLNSLESHIVTQGIRDSSLTFDGGGAFGVVKSSEGAVLIRNPNQLAAFQQVFKGQTYASLIERYATVRLNVVPVPPRDYKLAINGEDCPATERSVYRVLPGNVVVEATRPDKQPCKWSGTIARGREQVVDCAL